MLKDGFYVTNRGRTLIAGLMAGDTFAISKVMVGSGRPETLTALAEMTDLVSPVAAATSTKPLRKGDTVEMIIEYRSDLNGGLETGFWLNEFAVYAMDGDTEVMIYYGCLGDYPQWVSAYKDGAVDIRRYPVSLKVSADVQVKVSYPSMAFMTAEDCTQYISAHNSDSEAHPAIQNKFDRLLGEIDPLSGVGEPTSTTEGQVGQKYEDTTSGDIYTCTAITPGESGASPHYLWVPGRLGTLAEIRTAYSNTRERLVGINLLHNSYWAAKEYIINQRGQLEYVGEQFNVVTYCIDRWFLSQASNQAKVKILDNCLEVVFDAGTVFNQRFVAPFLYNKVVLCKV